ncbi:hypothetical protein B1J94_12235 [Leptospira kirschneri serovar Grippotyphosa]|nr:hypothetical protein B1J94_12235 [Leptospira kirschneri serovar Grippotyphosa]
MINISLHYENDTILKPVSKLKMWDLTQKSQRFQVTHNYIIKYLIFYIESVFCDRINGTQFYRDQ